MPRPPKGKDIATERFHVRLAPEDKETLKSLSEWKGLSISDLFREWIEEKEKLMKQEQGFLRAKSPEEIKEVFDVLTLNKQKPKSKKGSGRK